jgi:hypothetical protein
MRSIGLILLGTALALWGCDSPADDDDLFNDDDDTTAGDDDDTTSGIPSCADLGIPASYDEVETDYTVFEAAVFTLGEGATDLFSAGEIEALYALFHESVQALVTLEDMESFYDQIIGVGPLGDRVDYRSMGAGQLMYYYATYEWMGLVLGFTFGFDSDGAIMALSIGQMTDPLPEPYPDYDSAVEFQLPLPCLTYVVWGGRDELHNYHTYYAPNAYAYDFLVWQDGATCAAPCADNEDYYIFGLPILAPADGVVVEAQNDRPDMTPGEMDPSLPEGNHVTLEVAEGEYVLMGHMKQGSVRVEVGDQVTVGQQIGEVGNSGNTTEAHLHIHLQDQISYGSQGLSMPMDYYDLRIDGESYDRAMPVGSEFVSPAE